MMLRQEEEDEVEVEEDDVDRRFRLSEPAPPGCAEKDRLTSFMPSSIVSSIACAKLLTDRVIEEKALNPWLLRAEMSWDTDTFLFAPTFSAFPLW